jgi:hypothetical protein
MCGDELPVGGVLLCEVEAARARELPGVGAPAVGEGLSRIPIAIEISSKSDSG